MSRSERDGESLSDLTTDLQRLLNRHSAENASNTPDFVLARYLVACLSAFGVAVQQRDTWYGVALCPGRARSEESDTNG